MRFDGGPNEEVAGVPCCGLLDNYIEMNWWVRYIQLRSAEFKTTTTDLRRIMDMTHTLDNRVSNYTMPRLGGTTYNRPIAKIELTPSFCLNGSWKFQMVRRGRRKMQISVTIQTSLSQVISWAIDTSSRW